MNYFIVAIICIIALISGLLSLVENELFSRHRRNKFVLLAIVIIIEIVIDTITITYDGKMIEGIYLYKSLKIIEFGTTPCIMAILSSLVTTKSFWKKIKIYFIVCISANAILQMLNFFIPVTFIIDEQSKYHRVDFGYLYLIILVACFILLLISINNSFIKKTTSFSGTIYLTAALIVLGITLRIIFEESNSDWLCITISYFIFMIYFSNNYLKIDSITTLLNRKAFDRKLVRLNFETAIIVIDANSFKKVNDEFGHQSGDFALEKIAEAISKVYGKVGWCYRIGGDEFSIILKPNVLSSLLKKTENYNTFEALNKLTKALDEELAEMAKKSSIFRYGVSQGYDIYYPYSSFQPSDNYKSIDEVFKQADKNMYKNKDNSRKS